MHYRGKLVFYFRKMSKKQMASHAYKHGALQIKENPTTIWEINVPSANFKITLEYQ